MIYIISIIVMFTLIMGGIFFAAAPNIESIVEKDFLRQTNYNAKIAALEYATVHVRANNMTLTLNNPKRLSFGALTSTGTDNTTVINASINMTFNAVSASNEFNANITQIKYRYQ